MNTKMVSIVVPVYKVENELDRCVQSLRNQTYNNIEIILVDDGSPDNCPALCDEYSKMDIRIKTLHKTNGGLSDARNEGLKQALGFYTMFVDSDDYLEVDGCEKMVRCIEKTQVDFVVGIIREIHDNVTVLQQKSNIIPDVAYDSKEFIKQSVLTNEWYAPAVLNLYKTDFLVKNNLEFCVNRLYEDIEFLPKLYLRANRVAYSGVIHYNYIVRQNSITTSKVDEKNINDYILNLSSWKNIFDSVEDMELKKILFGALVKQYLYVKRKFEISGWKIKDVSPSFAIKYALKMREKAKVILYLIIYH